MARFHMETVDTRLASSRELEFPVLLADDAVASVRVRGRGPRVVVSHGNGMAIDAYRRFWEPLAERYQVVAFDFRHHGKSSPFEKHIQNWPQFVDDFHRVLNAIEVKLGPAITFGAFHSMSSLTALLHASQFPAPWRGLVVFEPPVPPPAGTPSLEAFLQMHKTLADGAARRKPAFAGVDDLMRSFEARESFRRMDRSALREFASASLRVNTSTGLLELACHRDFEAETFRLRHLEDAWARVSSVKLPVEVVAGLSGPHESDILASVARAIATEGGFSFSAVPDATHFMQLERPRQCIAIVDSFIKSLS